MLLEAATLPVALDVPGLPAWGPAIAPRLALEAQRFLFLALGCAVLAALVKLVKLFAYGPMPETAAEEGEQPGPGAGSGGGGDQTESEAQAEDEKARPEWEKERNRLRSLMRERKELRARWRRQARERSRILVRRLAADTLDLVVPGSILGWVAAGPGVVGLAMLGSTVLTAREVWERCGVEVKRRLV